MPASDEAGLFEAGPLDSIQATSRLGLPNKPQDTGLTEPSHSLVLPHIHAAVAGLFEAGPGGFHSSPPDSLVFPNKYHHSTTPSYALCNAATSSFFIFNIAAIARFVAALS